MRIFVYRRGPDEVGIDLQGLDVTTRWERLPEDARAAMLDEMTTRVAAIPEGHWRNYATTICDLDLTGAWWRESDWERYEELLARVSQALDARLRPGDIVEVEDEFIVLTGEAAWRRLPPSRFVTQLFHLGRGREPPPPPDRPSGEIQRPSGEPAMEVDGRIWPAPQIKLQSLVLEAVRNAQPAYEPLLESLPSHHQAHARKVVDEFLNNDLRNGLRRSDLSTEKGKVRALRRLLSLAVERERIVTITYRQDVLGPALAKHPELRRAMVRIWDDEVYHEVYFRTVQTRVLRPLLDSGIGRFGGQAAATLADESAVGLRRARAQAVKLGGRVSGKLGIETASGMRRSSPPDYCAHNVSLEVTACLAYDVMSAVLSAMNARPELLQIDRQTLARKVSQISGQELLHAQMFRDICVLIEGDADEETKSRLEEATRLVTSGAAWRSARGGATMPPSEWTVPNRGRPSSVLSQALDAEEERLAALERDLRAAPAPSICIQSSVDVRRELSDPAWADVEAVVAWVARWCATHSVAATIYIVDSTLDRLDARQALTVPVGALESHDLHLANVAQLTPHRDEPVPLTAQGGFYSSDSDILHEIWRPWVNAQLRIAIAASPDDAGFLVENLRALIMPVFDLWFSSGIDRAVAWREVPGLADVAALRLLGGFPPQISVARVRRRGGRRRLRRMPLEDTFVVGRDALAVDRRVAELTSIHLGKRELYAIASLLDD